MYMYGSLPWRKLKMTEKRWRIKPRFLKVKTEVSWIPNTVKEIRHGDDRSATLRRLPHEQEEFIQKE